MSETDAATVQEASQLKEQIASLAQKANEKYGELQTYYQQFTELRSEIQNKTQGIKVIHSNVAAKQTDIENVETQAKSLLAKVQAIIAEIAKMHATINDYHTKFSALKEQFDDENDGLDAIMAFAEGQKNELQKKYDEIVKIQGNAETIQKEIAVSKEHIEGTKQQTDQWKEKIEQVYGYMTGMGLAHSFAERKQEIEKSLRFWRSALGLSIVVLVGVLMAIYLKLETNTAGQIIFDLPRLLFRLTFSSPAIFGVWFSAKQYSRERGLLENYAFKAATAKALESYTDLLSEKFGPKNMQQVLDFVLSSMNNIYKHPNLELDMDDKKFIKKSALEEIRDAIQNANDNVVEPASKLTENAAKIAGSSS